MGTNSKIKSRPPELQDIAGAALIEIVLTITILGVALPAGWALLSRGYVLYAQNSLRQQAVVIAQKHLEQVWAYREENPYWYKTLANQLDQPVKEGQFRVVYDIRAVYRGRAAIKMWRVRVQVSHPQLPEPVILEMFMSRYVRQ